MKNDPSWPTFLLHKDIFIPEEIVKRCINLQKGLENRYISAHVLGHFYDDAKRYGYEREDLIKFLDNLETNQIEPFEVQIAQRDDGAVYVQKYCVRGPWKNGVNISVVIGPNYEYGMNHPQQKIITAWCNSSGDLHSTLNQQRYNNQHDIRWLNMKRVI